MDRFIVIVFAFIGAAFLLGVLFPKLGGIAFSVASVSITWLMLAACAVGILAYKVTK